MTTTPLPPLPSYGIWTTDEHGQRVMGFTPEQFLSLWQTRADLEAENKRLLEALTEIKSIADLAERGSERIALGQARQAARTALESKQ